MPLSTPPCPDTQGPSEVVEVGGSGQGQALWVTLRAPGTNTAHSQAGARPRRPSLYFLGLLLQRQDEQ